MRVDRGDRRRIRLPVDTLDDGFLARPYVLRHDHLVVIQNILRGVSAATAGLLIATGTRMLAPHRHHLQAMVVAALAVGGIGFAKLPLCRSLQPGAAQYCGRERESAMNGYSALIASKAHLALLSSISLAASPPSCRISAPLWSPRMAG